MYVKILINIFLMVLLLLIQIGFISGLPSWFSNINFVLVVIILLMGFLNFKIAFLWAMAAGLMLDMYSFSVFGLNTLGLTVSLIFTNFLLENLLTNRSLYSFLVLTFVATLIYELLAFLIILFNGIFSSPNLYLDFSLNFWLDEITKLAGNILLVFLLFQMLTFFGKRFRPMFLIR